MSVKDYIFNNPNNPKRGTRWALLIILIIGLGIGIFEKTYGRELPVREGEVKRKLWVMLEGREYQTKQIKTASLW